MSATGMNFKLLGLLALVGLYGCEGADGLDGAADGDLAVADVGEAADDGLGVSEAALTGTVAIGTTLKTTTGLNLRTGAGTGYSIILTIPGGATVTTVNRTTPVNGFYNVKYGTKTGWAHGNYLVVVASSTSTKLRVPLAMSATQCGNGRCYVTAYFDTNRNSGYRRDWTCRTGSNAKTYDNHTGTDYGIGGFAAMDSGSRQVLAARAGKVIARHDGEYDRCTSGNCGTANYVRIQHPDGKVTLYTHLKKWSVKVSVGQQVTRGQLLGLVGSSGRSTGPHLHLGYHSSGSAAATDPYKQTSSCGGSTVSQWCSQGSWSGLPGATCG